MNNDDFKSQINNYISNRFFFSFYDGEEQNEILQDSLGGACWLESRVIEENFKSADQWPEEILEDV